MPHSLNTTPAQFGTLVTRVCPMHLGHENVITQMIARYGVERCMLVIGSRNGDPREDRFMFTFEERRAMVRLRYPTLKIAGIDDVADDTTWLQTLATILATNGFAIEKAQFFGGYLGDVAYFTTHGYEVTIVNRFDASVTPVISATEVRNALRENLPLDGLVHPDLHNLLRCYYDGARKRLAV